MTINRRSFLGHAATGLSSMALLDLLQRDRLLAAQPIRPDILPTRPHAARPAHFSPKAKQILVIFCSGAISHMDTWDYKPELAKRHGQPLPGADGFITSQGQQGNLTRPLYPFRRYGQSGKMVSDLVSHIGEFADDICWVHSVQGKTNSHGPGENFMSTGFTADGFPSMGAWATYALGSENETLPAYVAIPDPRGKPQSSVNNWAPGFLPAAYQGVDFNSTNPVRNLARPASIPVAADRAARDLIQSLNRRHAARRRKDAQLEARIQSFELAYRMQMEATDAFDVNREPKHIRELYGEGTQARQLLIARRLVERGVRFVQVWHGSGQPWDNHDDIEVNHRRLAKQCDQGIGALLKDLKQRGMLDETLVLWGGEFGRTPTVELPTPGSNAGKINGRDHNHHGFTMWMAGGGAKGGSVYGATDEFGFRAEVNRMHVHDLHATMLAMLGFDHEKFTFRHAGRDFRLTDVHGKVIHDLIA